MDDGHIPGRIRAYTTLEIMRSLSGSRFKCVHVICVGYRGLSPRAAELASLPFKAVSPDGLSLQNTPQSCGLWLTLDSSERMKNSHFGSLKYMDATYIELHGAPGLKANAGLYVEMRALKHEVYGRQEHLPRACELASLFIGF